MSNKSTSESESESCQADCNQHNLPDPSLWNSAVGRRSFMKKTGMATAATAIALHGFRVEVLASTSNTPQPLKKIWQTTYVLCGGVWKDIISPDATDYTVWAPSGTPPTPPPPPSSATQLTSETWYWGPGYCTGGNDVTSASSPTGVAAPAGYGNFNCMTCTVTRTQTWIYSN